MKFDRINYSKMKLDSTNVTDVIATIKWSKNNFYFNKLSIIVNSQQR